MACRCIAGLRLASAGVCSGLSHRPAGSTSSKIRPVEVTSSAADDRLKRMIDIPSLGPHVAFDKVRWSLLSRLLGRFLRLLSVGLPFLRRRALLRLCVNHERARCAPIHIGHIPAEICGRERSVLWHCRAAPLFEPRVSFEFRCERSSTVRRSGFHARVATRAPPLQAADMSELSLLPRDQSRAVADTSSLHARRPARRRCYPGALRRAADQP